MPDEPTEKPKPVARPWLKPPWEKGVSGNPTGRPKCVVPDAISAEALERTVAIMRDPRHPDHFRALQELMNRKWGKPAVAVSIDTNNNGPRVNTPPPISDAMLWSEITRLREEVRRLNAMTVIEAKALPSPNGHDEETRQ